jgi:hypothetical protein
VLRSSVDYLATRGAFGDLHWSICADIVCCMNVMGCGGLWERRKSQSKDLPRDRSGSAVSNKRKRNRRKENEEENAKGNERGKAGTGKRGELRRVAETWSGRPHQTSHSWRPRVSVTLCRFILDRPLFICLDSLPLLIESRGDMKRCELDLLIALWSRPHKSASGHYYTLKKTLFVI